MWGNGVADFVPEPLGDQLLHGFDYDGGEGDGAKTSSAGFALAFAFVDGVYIGTGPVKRQHSMLPRVREELREDRG